MQAFQAQIILHFRYTNFGECIQDGHIHKLQIEAAFAHPGMLNYIMGFDAADAGDEVVAPSC